MQDVGTRAAIIDLFEVRGHVRRSAAAVSGNDRRTALHEKVRILARLFRRYAAIAVRVQIDEARRDDEPLALNHSRRAGELEPADGDNPIVLDGYVADDAVAIGTVVNRAAAKHQVGGDG